MRPVRAEVINGKLVEAYYWNDRFVIYVDGKKKEGVWEEVVENLKKERPEKPEKERKSLHMQMAINETWAFVFGFVAGFFSSLLICLLIYLGRK